MSGTINPAGRLRRIRKRKFRAWVLYQVVVPASSVAACWPIARWFFNVHYAFEKNFLSGDLLLLGVLLFIGIAVEIHSEEKIAFEIESVDPDDRLSRLFNLSQVLAFVFGALFWLVKIKSINFDFPPNSSPAGDSATVATLPIEINLSVILSIVGGFVAISVAYRAFKQVYQILLDAEIRELARTQSRSEVAKP